jgi:uncharacterized protein DUF6152
MRRRLAALSASVALVMASGAAAHHSFAMFDQDNPIELEGTVQEFKFTSPHTFIHLVVKGEDGTTMVWNLEGGPPSFLVRDGWSKSTLKPGDEVRMTVEPLRSGAPGGAWSVRRIKFRDGQPIVVTH